MCRAKRILKKGRPQLPKSNFSRCSGITGKHRGSLLHPRFSRSITNRRHTLLSKHRAHPTAPSYWWSARGTSSHPLTGPMPWPAPSISGSSISAAAPCRNASCLLTCLVSIVRSVPHFQGTQIYSFSLTLQCNQITALSWQTLGALKERGERHQEKHLHFFLHPSHLPWTSDFTHLHLWNSRILNFNWHEKLFEDAQLSLEIKADLPSGIRDQDSLLIKTEEPERALFLLQVKHKCCCNHKNILLTLCRVQTNQSINKMRRWRIQTCLCALPFNV